MFDHTPINQISYSILTGFNRNLESLELFYVMFNMTLSSYLHLFQCQIDIIDDIKRNRVISRSRSLEGIRLKVIIDDTFPGEKEMYDLMMMFN